MEDPMPNDKAISDALFDAIEAADEMMDGGRDQIASGAQWRSDTMAILRRTHTVAEIADRLKISRAAVYAALNESDPNIEERTPQDFLDAAVAVQLREYLSATEDAKRFIEPFFKDGVLLTDERKIAVAQVMRRVKSAENAYAQALKRSGRPVPHGLGS
jgi:hypothetical protein